MSASSTIVVYAWPMWWEAVVNNEHSESLWGPPLWIPFLFLPLGMTLLFLQYIVYIGRKIERLKSGAYRASAALSNRTEAPDGEKTATPD